MDPDTTIALDHVVTGQWTVIKVTGELDMASAPKLRAALDTPPDLRTQVALDLTALTFCDSTGLGVFMGAHKKLQDKGGRLVLLHVPDYLVRRLKITGIDRLITLVQSLEDL